MASEGGSPTYLIKELSPPPSALILEPSAEASSPAMEPQDVPVICTSDGTPAAVGGTGHYGRFAWTDYREQRLYYRRSRYCPEDA
jgi:hypothetical protein